MIFSNTEPFVRCAVHSNLASFNFLQLTAKDSRLFYIVSGTGKITISGTAYDFFDDTIILFREATQYKWETGDTEFYSLNFDYNNDYSNILEEFQPMLSDSFDNSVAFNCGDIEDFPQLNQPIVIHNAASLKNYVKNIITERVITDNYSQHLIPLLTKELILSILRLNETNFFNKTNNANSIKTVKKVIEFIYSNYSSDLTNQSIAQKFNFSPSHLGRIFKMSTSYSIHNFIL